MPRGRVKIKDYIDSLLKMQGEHFRELLRDREVAIDKAERAAALATQELKDFSKQKADQQNEWRGAINDVISKLGGKSEGLSMGWRVLMGALVLISTLIGIAGAAVGLYFAVTRGQVSP